MAAAPKLLLPSWERYKALFWQKGKMSILRNLQYEKLAKKKLKGKVLDFGGGANADYHRIISCKEYESVNIDKNMNPTYITKIGGKLPCPKNHYDTVLTMNTLEHVYDAKFAVQEMHGVLKKDGEFICALPFLYPIHAHPDDYFRPTTSWWQATLSDVGFKNIKITPLMWGPFSTGLVCSGMPGPLKTLRIHFALLLDLAYIELGRAMKKKYNKDIESFALGYFIEAKKV